MHFFDPTHLKFVGTRMRYIVFGIFFGLLQGCSYAVPSYMPSVPNQKILENATKQVAVFLDESESDDSGSLFCRGAGPVTLSDGETFSQYIVGALKQELQKTGKLSQQSNKKLIARYKRIDFTSTLGATNWYIDAMYKISGKEIPISTVYNDRSSFAGTKACTNVALYLRKAVEVHLAELYRNPIFQDELVFVTSSEDAGSDIEVRLLKLKRLRESGLITEDEFNRKRAKMIDSF